ncbi:MAG: gliding motility-associated C-terminal domain-containing protein [Flavobacteriales bacterium]|jgi:hypothetical protein|nr:gliding motility-associated C-terminal domain-containing protein [Flavobacteriales bacterium]
MGPWHGIPRGFRATPVLSVLLLALRSVAAPLDPPALRCASVGAGGDVIVTWSVPADPDSIFGHYEVFHATTAAGPFNLLGTVAVHGHTNYLHAGAGAGTGPRYYYVRTVTEAPAAEPSVPSDTVATVFLQVFQSTPAGSANLAWNAPAMAATATPVFTVWREYPAGTWAIIDIVDTAVFAYQHVIDICSDHINFRIGLTDQSGCVSFSNVSGDHFEDVTPPAPPTVLAVTVDTLSGLASVQWQPPPQTDTQGYIIVLQTAGGGVVIDTVWGYWSDAYEWPASTAGLAPEAFTVAAFDTCYSGTPPSPNTSATGPHHTTMHLAGAYAHCDAAINLQWTAYGGWPVMMHQVLQQVDGGPWGLVANVPGDVTTAALPAEPGRTYCFAVRAVQQDGAGTSLSNRACISTDHTGVPQYNYLRTVTVSAPDVITVVDSVDPGGLVAGYRFDRSANGGPWQEVHFVGGNAGPLLVFNDTDVDPATVGYRYRVVVIDACGHEAITSNIGGNIVLRAAPRLDGTNELAWNGYAQWAGTTVEHRLMRSVDGGPFIDHAVLPPAPWTMVDNVAGTIGGTGRACYRLEAVEGGNPSGIDALSMSNTACAVQEELVYIPNAFVVGGANPVFMPVLGFVDVRTYHLEVMNRWGQVIWHTNDPYKGWDGRVDGTLMPIGVYAYHCRVTNGAGRMIDRRGSVTLLTAIE